MEWTIRLEARTGWGEVTTCEIGAVRRGLGDLTADGVGLGLAEAKALLAELQQRIVQSQIDEYVTCARVCRDCLKLRRLRDQRTRTLQTLFGTVKVAAPRIRLCTCAAGTRSSASSARGPCGDPCHARRSTPACCTWSPQPPPRRDGRQGRDRWEAAAALRTDPAGRRAAGADRHSCTARSPRCAAWQGWVRLRPRAWPPAGTAAPRGLSNRGLLSTPRAMDSNRQS
jgi:hypothetical protein